MCSCVPPECECADVLTAEFRLHIVFRDERKAASLEHEDETIAREVPVMLIAPVMLRGQHMLGIAENRQREKQPFATIGEQWPEVGDMLEHVPHRHGCKGCRIRIEQ